MNTDTEMEKVETTELFRTTEFDLDGVRYA